MADPLYCTWIIGAPCVKPEVWAAWAQTFMSVAATALALYVPIRMKALEQLERIDEALEVANVLYDQYLTFTQEYLPTYERGTDLPAIPTELVALDADLATRATKSPPPFLLPHLVRMSYCSREILAHWKDYSGAFNKVAPYLVQALESPLATFEARLEAAEALRKEWRRRHRFTLAFAP